ncbi:MAG: hypothetical protein IIA60_08375 [Candidatus Marinimicrobia bacterium]|nr:hypothetical protein [Candidatus Neomarinimicrobiota bacterium]
MPDKTKPPLLDFWFFGPERGHLMRTVSIIREMTDRQELRLRLFVHPQHRELARRLLPESQHTIETYPGGLQLSYNADLDFAVGRTFRSILKYALYNAWIDYRVFRRAVKAERPALIVTDFIPLVPLYAWRAGIAIVGIYNYLLKETSLGHGKLRRLAAWGVGRLYRRMYRLCTIMILGNFASNPPPGANIRLVPPIARRATRSRSEVRRSLGADQRPLVFLSMGGGNTPQTDSYLSRFKLVAQDSQVQLLLLPRDNQESRRLKEHYPDYLVGEGDWVETQEVIAAADLVISRAGFTTVAESLKAGVPLLLWHVEAHPEIRETENNLLGQGLAAGLLTAEDDPTQVRLKVQAALEKKDLRRRLLELPTDGAERAADVILELLADIKR